METLFHLDQRCVDNVVDTSAHKCVDVCSGPQLQERIETLNKCMCTFDTSIAFDEDMMCYTNLFWPGDEEAQILKLKLKLDSVAKQFAHWRMSNVTKVVVFADRLCICSLYCFSFGLFQANSFSVSPLWDDMTKVIQKCDWMFKCRQSKLWRSLPMWCKGST